MLTREQEQEADAAVYLRQLEGEINDMRADIDKATRRWLKAEIRLSGGGYHVPSASVVQEINHIRFKAALEPLDAS